MSDLQTFAASVGASIVAGIILMNTDKILSLRPTKRITPTQSQGSLQPSQPSTNSSRRRRKRKRKRQK